MAGYALSGSGAALPRRTLLGGLLSARVLRMAPEDGELNTRLMIFLMDQGCTAEAVNHYAQLVRMAEAGGKEPPSLTAFQPS